MQLSSPRAQRLAVAFLVAVLVATVALLFVTAHRVAHAEGVSAPAAAPLRPQARPAELRPPGHAGRVHGRLRTAPSLHTG